MGLIAHIAQTAGVKVKSIGALELIASKDAMAFLRAAKDSNMAILGIDGFRVEGRIVVWRSDSVLQVPVSALFRRGNAWSLFVVEDGRARLRQVEVGQRTPLAAEIKSGVEAEAVVIVHPANEITDGTRVQPREQKYHVLTITPHHHSTQYHRNSAAEVSLPASSSLWAPTLTMLLQRNGEVGHHRMVAYNSPSS